MVLWVFWFFLLYGLLGVSGVKEKERVCWVLKGCFFGF